MHISVRAFAGYREAIGARALRLDLTSDSTVAQAWEVLRARYPGLHTLPAPAAFAVNDEYVRPDTPLRDNDELVLVPPVSGGMHAEEGVCGGDGVHVALTPGEISIDETVRRVRHPQAGAVVLFLGTIRDNREGARVHHLEYEAYETLALRDMRAVCAEAASRWPLLRVAMIHRVGILRVGEISVAIAVSAPHRADALAAGKYAIDALKQRVPIWKKEVWSGGEVWIGSEPQSR
jgi:molybdopterin synthase catalytic subunit/molybdopterin converting factor small subunit